MEHYNKGKEVLRVVSILICFVCGLLLLGIGFGSLGKMLGLGLMLLGLAVLLVALWLYNRAFVGPKQ